PPLSMLNWPARAVAWARIWSRRRPRLVRSQPVHCVRASRSAAMAVSSMRSSRTVAVRAADEAGRRREQVQAVVDDIEIGLAGPARGGSGPVAGQAVAVGMAAI